ncbi:GGDEF domain-containing protein [Desulfogranum mediterraneum]|uniref:GGDEF domain-containing protein n=1 Tax=Desulfogranum mediterraneum TaxID=160661 RepID=UPI0004900F20|nr:GGDEF domain-containing protein [Desulfogranum mediterraneum]
MNASTVSPLQDPQVADTMNTLLSELEHYRQQSAILQKVNILHQRIAGVLDLPTMLETYSIWIMEHCSHDLVGYYNPEQEKMHMYCSSHGPERRQAITMGEHLLRGQQVSPVGAGPETLHAFEWSFNEADHRARLVFIRKDEPFREEERPFLEQTLTVIAAPLQRTLEFEKVFSQVRRDTLTGLPNRFVFEERIDMIIEQARRHGHPLTIAALDLDHFKSVNDTMGHPMGDRVLQDVARVMEEQIRQTDLLVRMGGDEFLLILPDTDIHKAKFLTRRLVNAVDRLNVLTTAGKLGVSIGLSQWSQGVDKKEWLETADDILYRVKARGKARHSDRLMAN